MLGDTHTELNLLGGPPCAVGTDSSQLLLRLAARGCMEPFVLQPGQAVSATSPGSSKAFRQRAWNSSVVWGSCLVCAKS